MLLPGRVDRFDSVVQRMKHWLLVVLTILVALASLVFAWYNSALVALDLFGFPVSLPLGVVVLASLFTGCLLGGGVLLGGVILPLRLRLRKAQRRDAQRAVAVRPDSTA
jgi:putative membrane protein